MGLVAASPDEVSALNGRGRASCDALRGVSDSEEGRGSLLTLCRTPPHSYWSSGGAKPICTEQMQQSH